MKTKFQIGDYVRFKVPYSGVYPVGIIIGMRSVTIIHCYAYRLWNKGKLLDLNEISYEIKLPDNQTFYRPRCGLIKSTEKTYIKHTFLKKIEL